MLNVTNHRVLRKYMDPSHVFFLLHIINLMYSFLGIHTSTKLSFSSSIPVIFGNFTLGATQRTKHGYKVTIYARAIFFTSKRDKFVVQLMRVIMHELHHVSESEEYGYASETIAEAHENLYAPFYKLYLWLTDNYVHLSYKNKTRYLKSGSAKHQ